LAFDPIRWISGAFGPGLSIFGTSRWSGRQARHSAGSALICGITPAMKFEVSRHEIDPRQFFRVRGLLHAI
jgi:hypothetical protein